MAARKWQVQLAPEQHPTNNHDLGFMIIPSITRKSRLTASHASLGVVINAARCLATRYDPVTKVIRSWAGAKTKVYDLSDPAVDFAVVIDSMMNMDLLYYATEHTGETRLAGIAMTHAKTTLRNHVRDNYSTYHLVNYEAQDGFVRNRLTCQ